MQSLSYTHRPPSALGSNVSKPDPRGSSAGLSVAVLPTITTFLSSLSPGYVPEHIQRSAYNAPPPMADTGENRPAHDALQRLKLACNVASHWLPSVKVVSDAVAVICSSLSLSQDLGDVLDSSQRCAGVALTLVALESLPTAAAVPAPGERGSPQQPITVADSETLSKIGQDNYPADAYYNQTSSFSHNSSEPIVPFRGHYDGGCHTISDLNTCLFSQLDRYAVVRNLNLADATIDGDQRRLAALACEMAPFSRVRDIRAERITISNKHSGVFFRPATTGVITGYQSKASNVSGIEIHNCSVSTSGEYSSGGVVAGQVVGLQEHINVTDSQAASRGPESHSGIGAGELRGEIHHMLVTDSQTRTFGPLANAGTGAGKMDRDSKLSDFGATRCNASTRGEWASVGIGAGLAEGKLNRLTVVKCNSKSAGEDAFAGLGAGQLGQQYVFGRNQINTLFCVDGVVETVGPGAFAGVAAGSLRGEASNIVSARCKVFTSGTDADAGVGAGDNRGQITGLTSVNDTVDARGGGKTGLGAPSGTVRRVTSVNTLVDDDLINQGLLDQSQLCSSAGSRFVANDCKVLPTQLEQPPASCPSTPVNSDRGSFWHPIEINDIETLNSIGLQDSLPSDAHYIQTRDLDGSTLDSDGSAIFTGHYDGQNHVIHHQPACLFNHLRGTVRNLNLIDARITARGQPAGVVACTMDHAGGIEDIRIDRCHVFGPGVAGIVSGQRLGADTVVARVQMHNASVETTGIEAHAGGVAGRCRGITHQINITKCQVITRGFGAQAGAGGGQVSGDFGYLACRCTDVKTFGNQAIAGLGAGVVSNGWLGPVTGVNSTVSTEGRGAAGGIGAGAIGINGRLRGVNALNCRVLTKGQSAPAGVGAGNTTPLGGATNITSVNSQLVTTGPQSHAGTCAGVANILSILDNCTSVNSIMNVTGAGSQASLGSNSIAGKPLALSGIKTLNTRVNGQLYHNNSVNHSTLCAAADPQFIQPDCQPQSMAQTCPVLSLNLTALASPPPSLNLTALTTPTVAPFNLTMGIAIGGAVVGSVLLFGAIAFAANYCLNRRENAQPQNRDIGYFWQKEGN